MHLFQIPNFLHLTPSAIKKHCEALKRNVSAYFSLQHSSHSFSFLYGSLVGSLRISNVSVCLSSAFCTEWPSALDTDAKCDERFPIKVENTDYVSAGPSVRNPSARVVSVKVSMFARFICFPSKHLDLYLVVILIRHRLGVVIFNVRLEIYSDAQSLSDIHLTHGEALSSDLNVKKPCHYIYGD